MDALCLADADRQMPWVRTGIRLDAALESERLRSAVHFIHCFTHQLDIAGVFMHTGYRRDTHLTGSLY
jgi:hypothetical protein